MIESRLTGLVVVACLTLPAAVGAEEGAAPPSEPTREEIAAILELREVLENLEVLEHLDALEVLPLLKEQEDDLVHLSAQHIH